MKRTGESSRRSLHDGAFVVGIASFVFGAWLAWHPLGFIVGGVLLAVLSFLTGYRKPEHEAGDTE